MKRSILASFSLLALSTLSWAQRLPCGTDLERARLIATDPTYLEREAVFLQELQDLIENSASQRDDDQVYVLPIVFHVLHLRGKENITNEQILDQVAILNRDYAKLNADSVEIIPAFRGRFADMKIQFRLPTIDPIGNCTNGIVRHQSVETFRGESTSKLKPWPRDKYINVWLTDGILSGAAGYFTYGGFSVLDGIMLKNDYVGSIGTSDVNRSRALTHEVGHFLSLAHVWGSNNGVADPDVPQCHMQAVCGDDGVEDTPFTRGWECCPAPNDLTFHWADCDQQSFKTFPGGGATPIAGVTYTFDGVTNTSGTTDPTTLTNVRDTIDQSTLRATMSPFNATGVSGNSTVDGSFGFSGWGTGAADGEIDFANMTGSINNAQYYEFMLTPDISQQMTLNSLSFKATRNGTGPRTFSVRSSANNFAQNIPMTVGAGASVVGTNIGFFTADGNDTVLVNIDPITTGYTYITTPLTFRLYAWNAEDADGAFVLDSLNILGKTGTMENVQNYMEYSYCSVMFTEGQRARARAALNSPTYQRDRLWTEATLQATGVADGFQVQCAPEADFYAQVGFNPSSPIIPFPPYACESVDVRFVDNSAKAFADSWAWTFQDGVPATSTERNPVVQFTSPGYKSVTLTVTNAQGSTSKTDPYAVFIGNPSVALGPYYEGFDSMNGTDLNPYVGFNYDLNHTNWRRFNGGGFSGTSCAMLNSADRNQLDFIDPDNAGDYDDLVTPLFNLTGAPSATFSFRYAYYTNTAVVADITEKLEVWSSTDCGRTWLLRGTMTGTELLTNGNNNSLPPAEWKLKSYTLPGSLLSSNVRFRFRYISTEFSGNLFIDDVFIGVPVGMAELMADGFLSVFPNPTNDLFALQVYGMDASATEVTVTDMRGAIVYRNKYQATGGSNIELSAREMGLSEGMYLLRASNSIGSSVQKLILD